ncbi:MAG: hypothetical protein DRO05_08140 [Thermoproteota archaeon]|nr:MAG: hypothetical protein DRO05_08140 [Candidatus Korarchaeota archaeon]
MANKFFKKPPEELLEFIEEILSLPKSAISILEILLREKEATIERLMKLTSISRRTAHEQLKKMRKLGLITRKASEIEGRLKYVYSAASISEIIEILKKSLQGKLRKLEELQKRVGRER